MSESDELLPLQRPQLPFDVSGMKRVHDDGPDSKRVRVYRDDNGEEVVIHKDLMADLDPLFDASSSLEASEDEFADDDKDLKRAQRTERNTRTLLASEIVRAKRRGKKKLTSTEAMIERILSRSNYTNEDLAKALQHDDYNLISAPVLSPLQSLVNKTLGPEQPRTACFGCTKGVGLARVASRTISNLEHYIKDTIASQDMWTACLLIAQYFEQEIMVPSNNARRKGEAKIAMWNERSIWDHLTNHILEPSFVLMKSIHQTRMHIDIIANGGLYKVPREIAEDSQRNIDLTDIKIDPNGHKQFIESQKLLLQLMSQKPENMMFSNANFNAVTVPQRIIAPKDNAVMEVVKTRSVFSKTDLTREISFK